jgi:hypothetical protein
VGAGFDTKTPKDTKTTKVIHGVCRGGRRRSLLRFEPITPDVGGITLVVLVSSVSFVLKVCLMYRPRMFLGGLGELGGDAFFFLHTLF